MYVETWLHFREFLEAIYTGLSRGDQKYANLLFPFIENNKNKNTGVVQGDLDNIITWLNDNVLPQVSGGASTDVSLSITFLRQINVGREARHCKTVEGCHFWDNFWYGGGCHEVEEEVPPTPDDEKLCHEWPDRGSCLKAGCFWAGRNCVATIPDVLVDPTAWDWSYMALDISIDYIVERMSWMDTYQDYFLNTEMDIFWYYAAALYYNLGDAVKSSVGFLQADVFKVATAIGDIWELDGDDLVDSMIDVEDDIGDMSLLGEDTLVDAILNVEGGGDAKTKKVVDALLPAIGYEWIDADDDLKRIEGGLVDRILWVMGEIIDKETGEINIATRETVKGWLDEDFNITESTIKDINDRIDALLLVISSDVDTVTFNLDDQLSYKADSIFDLVPANVGWVKDYVHEIGFKIVTAINDAMQLPIELLNYVAQTILELPEWWIKELKERLGI